MPSRGFTLIELMIVTAVIAILAALAYPSYTEHLRSARRSEAASVLLDAAARQHQLLIEQRSYSSSFAALNLSVPPDLARYYTLSTTVTAGPPPGFSVAAAPIGAQAGDRCGTLSVDHLGTRSASTGADRCW